MPPNGDIAEPAWPSGYLAAVKTTSKPAQTRVTSITILRTPGNFVVVAHAAEFPLNNISHGNVVAASAHNKTIFIMAHIASKSQAMKPVWKDHWPHTFFFGSLIEHQVAILPLRHRRGQRHTGSQYDQPPFQ